MKRSALSQFFSRAKNPRWMLIPCLIWFLGCASSKPGFDPKHDGRFTRLAVSFPLTPFVYGWMGFHILAEDRGPQAVDFERAVQYSPSDFTWLERSEEFEPRSLALLKANAPIIVQELNESASYHESIDQIGSPRPHIDEKGRKRIEIDTSKPALYAFTSEAVIQDQARVQLNYVYWFPEHPKAKALFDPEAGKIEGLTLRITLGRDDRPVFYETIYNCGCYHRVYPARWVDDRAREEFGPPAKKFHTAVQEKRRFKIDFYAPESVRDSESERLVVFSESGRHMPIHLGREADIAGQVEGIEHASLAVHSYSELERGGEDGLGIFNPNTLVAGADRAETWMLFSTGMYHAGTPRRRGAQMIHFDQYDFDDPRLLEKNLKTPSGI